MPPTGSQRSVQRSALAPGLAFSWMTRETFDAGQVLAAVPLLACTLPHALRAAAQVAAIRMDRALVPARSMCIIMPLGRGAGPHGSARSCRLGAEILSACEGTGSTARR